ncbi:type II toxin-antitoxin system VapC family toxin [Rhizobium straminoryzae]|uniref:Ribonuclease VapC n=1 Tax=Rhizobium straminoryzae TaxID=1387186 RepID=A0A549TCP4_9HYPH|nr:type II toxin-antitoxin system VapC family toxin [Rhizobium straminoryzae]TRL39690.1 type II toxin-antitoxin system VapC family toxin [Rhizobium straminoryzae]
MIVVDTSALIAILKTEDQAAACEAALNRATTCLISAATLTEALIVSARRRFDAEMKELLSLFSPEVIDVTTARAEQAADAYRRFGKNFHPASLNFGDCFAYATAREFGCPLPYIGEDFAQTDLVSALSVAQP